MSSGRWRPRPHKSKYIWRNKSVSCAGNSTCLLWRLRASRVGSTRQFGVPSAGLEFSTILEGNGFGERTTMLLVNSRASGSTTVKSKAVKATECKAEFGFTVLLKACELTLEFLDGSS